MNKIVSGFNSEQYLARIGFIPIADQTVKQRLFHLHRSHVLTVPFENFDPFCKISPSLELDNIYAKVVSHRRGGYCFELNSLFNHLLMEQGYTVDSILCRPFSGEGVRLPLTHRLLSVRIGNKQYLADVGLGGNGWIEPLEMQTDTEQEQFGRIYRIMPEGDGTYTVQLKRKNDFVNAVAFQLKKAEESDFEMSNYYTSTYPESPFVKRMMCTLPTENGRYTLRDGVFKEEYEDEVIERSLTVYNFEKILHDYFSITLPESMKIYIRTKLEVAQYQ